MNNQELEARNKTLEKRWKIVIIIAILFVLSRPVALYIVNNLIHKAADSATANDFPLVDPARQFISQKDYIVNIQALRDYFSTLSTTVGSDNISVYYEQLNSGANISVNRNLSLFPASLTKLPLALVVAKKVEGSEWNWDTKLTVTQDDIDPGSGNLYQTVKAGDTLTVDSLLSSMIVDSDNTAQHIFLRQMKQSELDAFLAEVGLQDLFNAQGFISAQGFSRILRVLYTSSYLERENSEKILTLMSQEKFHDFLSQGIPDDVTFAHKFGENLAQSIFADSGIVYITGKPYMITVILKGKDSTDATRKWAVDIMKEISTRAYQQGVMKVGYTAPAE